MKPPRKLHIKSYGCQMNVYDAQRMVDTLAPEGFVETASVDDADLVILNTCHIREKASEKVYSELGRLRVAKDEAARNGRTLNIAVAGCVAQAEGEEIIRRAPGGRRRRRPAKLPSSAATAGAGEDAMAARIETEFPVEDKFGFLPPPKPDGDPRARHFVLRHRAGRLRQILHLLRGALYARRRGVAAGRQDRRRRAAACRQRRARNHADRAERQRLSRRRSGRPDLVARQPAAAARRHSRHRPAALLDQPSARRRRTADRSASRSAGADAVRASAGAIRFRPDSCRHEPQAYRR